MTTISTYIGFSLFVISELLPFLPIKTNGILQTFISGFNTSCSNPSDDIAMAQQLITNKDNIAGIVNTMGTNKVIQNCFENIISNQHMIPVINNMITSHQMTTINTTN